MNNFSTSSEYATAYIIDEMKWVTDRSLGHKVFCLYVLSTILEDLKNIIYNENVSYTSLIPDEEIVTLTIGLFKDLLSSDKPIIVISHERLTKTINFYDLLDCCYWYIDAETLGDPAELLERLALYRKNIVQHPLNFTVNEMKHSFLTHNNIYANLAKKILTKFRQPSEQKNVKEENNWNVPKEHTDVKKTQKTQKIINIRNIKTQKPYESDHILSTQSQPQPHLQPHPQLHSLTVQ